MKRSGLFEIVCASIFIVITSTANAALTGILPATSGGTDWQAYYDDVLDISWAANANINGADTWDNQMAWVSGLTIGGISGWRLPTPDVNGDGAIKFCPGSDCIDNEVDYLYTVYGVTQANPTPFTGMPAAPAQFWTSFEQPNNPNGAWFFGFGNGNATYADKNLNPRYAWAVHDGDVSAIPIPAAAWLFGSGLLSLLGLATRKKTIQ